MLSLIGLCVALTAVSFRAIVAVEPIPHWDGDPTVLAAPRTAIGPAVTLALDAITLAACAVSLIGGAGRTGGIGLLMVLLLLAGACSAAWHSWLAPTRNLEGLRQGATWASSLALAVSLATVCRDPRMARLTLGVLCGLFFVMALRAGGQYFIEHPQTVAAFKENRDQYLAAQGWSPGSAAARAFERRLMQAEATGWFGLSNVMATFMAVATVLGAAMVLATARVRKAGAIALNKSTLTLACIAAGASLVGLALAMSKGGTAAAVVGILLFGMTLWSVARFKAWSASRRAGVGSLVGLCIVTGAFATIPLRGMIGERLGELSLLFRWFYMQGAMRAFRESPLFGTGPGGFKDAYIRLKPAVSPEEVTSPHSVILDYIATLGAGGIAWVVVLLVLVAWAGRALFQRATEPDSGDDRAASTMEMRFVFIVASAATLGSVWRESGALTADAAIIRLVGLAGWLTIGSIACRVSRLWPAAITAVGAAALAAVGHAQIEVTAVWNNSAPLFMCVLGLGAGVGRGPAADSPLGSSWLAPIRAAAGPLVLAVMAGMVGVLGVRPVWRWESHLDAAAEAARPAAEMRQRLAMVGRGPHAESPESLARDASALLGRPVMATQEALPPAVGEITERSLRATLDELHAAALVIPGDFETLRACSRVGLQLASVIAPHDAAEAVQVADRAELDALDAAATGRRVTRFAELALKVAGKLRVGPKRTYHGTPSAWAALANLRTARADLLNDRGGLERAVGAWMTQVTMDPFGLAGPTALAEISRRIGDRPAEASWLRRVLELDEFTRLDPLKGLTEGQRSAFEARLRDLGGS